MRLPNLKIAFMGLVLGVLAFVSCGMAAAVTPPADPLGFLSGFLRAALENLVSFAFTFGSGALPALVVAWVVDRVVQFIPWLAPYRQYLEQFVRSRLEELQRARAERAAFYAGHLMRLEQDRLSTHDLPQEERDEVHDYLKQIRDANAQTVLVQNRTVRNMEQARELLTSVVGELKIKGINP